MIVQKLDAVCVNQRQQVMVEIRLPPIAQALCPGIQDRARETLHETLQLRFEIESRMKNYGGGPGVRLGKPKKRKAK
jgi:hypothetical protein